MKGTVVVRKLVVLFLCVCSTIVGNTAWATEATPPPSATDESLQAMDNARLAVLIKRIDKAAEGKPGFWRFHVQRREVMVITDERTNRMRIIVPIEKSVNINAKQMKRMMQANFDSALDARYAIAKEVLWSAYVHPLASLRDKQFLEALGQVVNLALTYGSSYSSGGLIFRGGDSETIERRKLIEELIDKGLAV